MSHVFSVGSAPRRVCRSHSTIDEAIATVRREAFDEASMTSPPKSVHTDPLPPKASLEQCERNEPSPPSLIRVGVFRLVAHTPTLLLPTSVRTIDRFKTTPRGVLAEESGCVAAAYSVDPALAHGGYGVRTTVADLRKERAREANALPKANLKVIIHGTAGTIETATALPTVAPVAAVAGTSLGKNGLNGHVTRVEHLGERVPLKSRLRDISVLDNDVFIVHVTPAEGITFADE